MQLLLHIQTFSQFYTQCLPVPPTLTQWYLVSLSLKPLWSPGGKLFIIYHFSSRSYNKNQLFVCLSQFGLSTSSVCFHRLAMRQWITFKHWFPYFLHSTGSCRKKCFDSSYKSLDGCRCDEGCKDRGDCCWDFEDTCVESSMNSEHKFIIVLVVLSLASPNAHNTPCVVVFQGYHNKVPQSGWFKQQKLIFSQYWTLEVQDPWVGRVGSFWRLCRRTCSMTLFQLLRIAGDLWNFQACGCLT